MKCAHGSHVPTGDTVARYCPLCNPDGVAGGDNPVLPRSSGDPLFIVRSNALETCPDCGNIRMYFSPSCRHCNHIFPETDLRGREQGTANAKQPGVCPTCGSAVHYETKKKGTWACVDCDTKYPAPRRKNDYQS